MAEQRYRLPDELGGQRVDVVGKRLEDGDVFWRVVVRVGDESFPMTLPATALVCDLPPEPRALASVVQIGASFFEKRHDAGINWFDVGANTWVTWEQVCSVGTPTVLVPDPFAEPVELPWSATDVDGDRLRVEEAVPRNGQVLVEVQRHYVDISAVSLPSAVIRDAARALWSAADRAESGQS